jgi:hypothetical protein
MALFLEVDTHMKTWAVGKMRGLQEVVIWATSNDGRNNDCTAISLDKWWCACGQLYSNMARKIIADSIAIGTNERPLE